jgi:hypothetical protein
MNGRHTADVSFFLRLGASTLGVVAALSGCGSKDDTTSGSGDGAAGVGGHGHQGGAGGEGGQPSTDQPGKPAKLGDPSSTIFNGLLTVRDPFAKVPSDAKAAFVATMPTGLAAPALPFVPEVKVVTQRDSAIFYVANVAGAADYRAYVVDSSVDFADTKNGPQPRNAVVVCAGFRQHTYQSAVVDGHHTRELLQAVEVPGLVKAGKYSIVLEATSSPCPYVGMPSQTDAQITMGNDGTTNEFHAADPSTYHYKGIPLVVLRSPKTLRALYKNEIINGQGASIDYPDRETVPFIGQPVAPDDATFPSDPVVIARSAFTVEIEDQAANPSLDVGPHSFTEDFGKDMAADPASMQQNPDYGTASNDFNGFSINPMFQMGTWEFWGRFMQAADKKIGQQADDFWSSQALTGTEVFVRHGRLHTTFGDSGEDVGGSLSFGSLEAPVVEMSSSKYIHSVFRINSEATHRRYWYWTLCGGDTSDELFDSQKKEYKLRPILFETSFGPGGNNPSFPQGHTLESSDTSDDAIGIAKECLSITEEGRPEDPFRTDGSAQTSAVIRAQIHPKNKTHGIIALGNHASDTPVLDGEPTLGFRFRVDATGKRVGPMIDPYDQLQPLVQYDIFVKQDRLVVFINKELGFCADLSGIPFSMKSAMIGYGDLLYHSSVEYQEISDSAANKDAQLYQYLLNQPIVSSRLWDTIGHSDGNDLPADFKGFDPALCRKPADTSVRGS